MLDQVPEYWAVIQHAAEELAGFSGVLAQNASTLDDSY
jgi:hypothetical protein